jgi:energy-coupling factor transporter ATP-binding protein EcfA2
MAHRISIERIGSSGPLTLEIGDGDRLFVVGPNGAGKSSLINRLAGELRDAARVVWAHRHTWFTYSAVNLSPRARLDVMRSLVGWEGSPDARWRDAYGEQRSQAALFDLIAASFALSRRIARIVPHDVERAKTLACQEKDPIERLNEMFRGVALQIEIDVNDEQEILARKRGSEPFPASELSDGERNALLLASDVLGARPGLVFLIDEPERHLHRAIAAPLLKELFAARPDCAFIIATHDLSLVMEHPGRRVLLLRDCTFTGGNTARWDLDILEGDIAIADDDKRTILGARSVLVFVEGEDGSLDMALYRLLFPTVTVAARGGSRAVEATVRSLRAIKTLHWLDAFGIVDRDGRSEEEITRLRAEGIHVLPVCTVESIYYHPEAIRLVARQQATNFGCDAESLAAEAEARALDALKTRRNPLIEARCRSAVEQRVLESLWRGEGPWQSSAINLPIDPAAMLATEAAVFDDLIAKKDLVGLVARYGIKKTGLGGGVSQALRFQKVGDYPEALRARLEADATARDTLICLFGDLPQLLAEATDPARRAERTSVGSQAAAAG